MLRYADVNFFGVPETLPGFIRYNEENTSNPDQTNFNVRDLMYTLIWEARETDTLFKTDNQPSSDGSIQNYGLVQCTRDIDGSACGNCLDELLNEAKDCCQAQKGWRVSSPSCNLRYEQYSFTEQAPATPPLPPQSVPAAPPAPLPQSVPAAPPPPPPGTGKICRFGIFMEIPPFACFELLNCTFIYANVYMGNLFSSHAL